MFSFGKPKRLLNARDFQGVFNNNQFRASHKHLLILAKPTQNQTARLGVVVAKKHVKLAVQRNQFKRVVREQFRLQQKTLQGLDIVVLARAGVNGLSKHEQAEVIRQCLNKILQKAHA